MHASQANIAHVEGLNLYIIHRQHFWVMNTPSFQGDCNTIYHPASTVGAPQCCSGQGSQQFLFITDGVHIYLCLTDYHQ